MFSESSIYRQVAIAFFASAVALQTVFAADDETYINALSNEAKRTKMSEADTAPESEADVEKPAGVKQPNNTLFKKVQRALGINDETNDKVVNDLEKAVSSSSEKVDNKADIRKVVSDAMADFKGEKGQAGEGGEPKSLSKTLNQIIEESKDVPTSDVEQNYVRSLKKELFEESATKLRSYTLPTAPVDTGYRGVNQSNISSMNRTSSVSTITVLKGESLSKISQRIYGTDKYYWLLYKANRDEIADPDFITVGQILQVPDLP